mmetsp:Transcript_51106/g.101694  ORF Transcript_51106/g.101694 Transcript_51106/m.101694 type:complete len:333 (-) Transcript_51106:463-1461(-)
MRQGARTSETPKEGEVARSPEKEFTTKAEYNRALLRQEKWHTAEGVRADGKVGEEIIKDRQRRHTAQGLSRQQAAAAQMKKASESLEAHRQQNLALGKEVAEQVEKWGKGAKAVKDEYAGYAKEVKEAIKAADRTAQSVKAETAKKKATAALTRADDEAKEKVVEQLKEKHSQVVKDQVAKIRAETDDKVVDGAKRHFYEQRLKSAVETKAQQLEWEKERAAAKEKHQATQDKRRIKSKSARTGSAKSKQELITERATAAAAVREAKRALAEENKARKQEDFQLKSATVKGVIANSFVQPTDALDATSPANSQYSLTNIRPPSPLAERVEAA